MALYIYITNKMTFLKKQSDNSYFTVMILLPTIQTDIKICMHNRWKDLEFIMLNVFNFFLQNGQVG